MRIKGFWKSNLACENAHTTSRNIPEKLANTSKKGCTNGYCSTVCGSNRTKQKTLINFSVRPLENIFPSTGKVTLKN